MEEFFLKELGRIGFVPLLESQCFRDSMPRIELLLMLYSQGLPKTLYHDFSFNLVLIHFLFGFNACFYFELFGH